MAYDFKADHRFKDISQLNTNKMSEKGEYKLYDEENEANTFPNPLLPRDNISYKSTNDDEDKKAAGIHHYDEKVNPNKFVDFWVGSPTKSKFNWRTYVPPGWRKEKGIKVHESVMLIPSNAKFKATVSMALEQWSENLGKAGGIIELINAATGAITGSSYIREFGTPSLFKDVDPISFDNLTFEFKFGSAGLFSGLEEVVKPIFAIALIFAPTTTGDFPQINGQIMNPFPTKLQFFFMKLLDMKNQIQNIASEGIGGGGFTQSLVDANRRLQNLIAAGNASAALSARFKNIWMSYGPFTFGPMQCPSFSYEFDMDHLDEFGWPIAGRITLTGLKTSRKGTSNAILGQIAHDGFSEDKSSWGNNL